MKFCRKLIMFNFNHYILRPNINTDLVTAIFIFQVAITPVNVLAQNQI